MEVDDKGTLDFALDMRIQRDPERGILKLSQKQYVDDLLAEYEITTIRHSPAPVEDLREEDFLQVPIVVSLKQVVPRDVYIGRECFQGEFKLTESKWKNPFRMRDYNNDRKTVLNLYRNYVENTPELMVSLEELSGKRLFCWCSPEPCQ